jgi:hypothetical protein
VRAVLALAAGDPFLRLACSARPEVPAAALPYSPDLARKAGTSSAARGELSR